jgi:hypothetical protein
MISEQRTKLITIRIVHAFFSIVPPLSHLVACNAMKKQGSQDFNEYAVLALPHTFNSASSILIRA